MYVITFYSFKGGVGRSMALVNVGVELAMAGKRVLLVDFDLEAPSLTSFDIGAASSCSQGIVDYVNAFLTQDRAPNVAEYISSPQEFGSGGLLWIMPAGKCDDDYQSKLANISWVDLYERNSGYLLIEEMKAQWEEQLKPDYVLIDSRTGHSDVSGICTRQLPDAVAFVFVPNRQNLDGLSRMVRQVRAASREEATEHRELFFVESNVPYYDDERRTLESNRRMFRDQLHVDSFSATVHQHPHLSVLNQSVFVREFPETSLAQEYRVLTEKLRSRNLADRDAVIPQLKKMIAELRTSREGALDSSRLARISELHGNDPEVCFLLGRISRLLGEDDAALIQFSQAIESGFVRPESFLERASLRIRQKDQTRVADAISDLRKALDLLAVNPKYSDTLYALRTLMSVSQLSPVELAGLPAVQALTTGQKITLTLEMYSSDQTMEFVYLVLSGLVRDDQVSSEEYPTWCVSLALACIRTKRMAEAIEILSKPFSDLPLEQARLFNRAIAEWALRGSARADDFTRIVDLYERLPTRRADPNYLQCMAIATYVCGKLDLATQLTERAKRQAFQTPKLHFSALRYLAVSPIEFGADCDELRAQIEKGGELSFPATSAAVLH